MKQNTSHAVMSQASPQSRLGRNFFPTPPWATRALVNYLTVAYGRPGDCWDPAAGEGHMTVALKDSIMPEASVWGSDIFDYGAGFPVLDFLAMEKSAGPLVDWIITNPPFNKAVDFAHRCLDLQPVGGFALLVRTTWLEGGKRYEALFRHNRPSYVMVFTEQVPMLEGVLNPKASSATSYSWFVWDTEKPGHDLSRPGGQTKTVWFPPGTRKNFERAGDYDPLTPAQRTADGVKGYEVAMEALRKAKEEKEGGPFKA